jgi:putative ABC transport system permease protein
VTFRDLLSDTIDTLRAHRLRTGLTMFGLAWGAVSITLMSAAGDGFRIGSQRVQAQFGENIAIMFAGRTSLQAGGERAGRPVRWNAGDWEVILPQAPSCKYVLPELGQGSIPVRSAFNNGISPVNGSLPPFQQIRNIPTSEGRFYSWEDHRAARRVAVLGSEVRKQLFAERPAVGQEISVGGFPYQVIGVMKSKEQDNDYDGKDIYKIYVPFGAMIRDFPNKPPQPPQSIDQLLVLAHSLDVHQACLDETRHALARLHNFDPDDKEAANIWDTVEQAKGFAIMANGMKYFLGAIGVVTLFLGGIGVMNVMLVAVRERTREIGLRKAVGATSRSILAQFFLETLFIVLFSGSLGLAFAYALCAAVNTLPMPMYFAGLIPTWDVAIVCVSLLGLVSFCSALYPASRASSIDPVEALRFEAGG